MNAYDTYEVEDFVADEQFCRWVLYPDGKEKAIFEAFLNAHPEKASMVEEAREWVLGMQVAESSVSDQQVDRLWARIEQTVAEPAVIKPFWNRTRILSLAAAIVGMLVLVWVGIRPSDVVEYATAKGAQPERIELPDGSEVYLNAESRLTYSKKEWKKEGLRSLQLAGEARFDVTEGLGQFQVHSQSGTVTVLGTEFNIFDRGSNWEVKCFSGKVRVEQARAGKVELNPQMETNYLPASQELKVDSFVYSPSAYKDWIQGYFEYEEANLVSVLEEVGRQFDQGVSYPANLQELVFTGSFERESSLTKVLEDIMFPYANNYSYKLSENQILIEKK